MALPILHAEPVSTHPERPHLRLVVVGHPSTADRRSVSAVTYRRRRLVAGCLLVLVFVAAWFALGRLGEAVLGDDPAFVPEHRSSGVHGGQVLVPGGTYVVQAGDTMWDIARAFQPHGDVTGLVRTMVRSHGGPELAVGERLVLPG